MVGTGRFELPTPRTPSECSTRLSHVPTDEMKPLLSQVWGEPQRKISIIIALGIFRTVAGVAGR